MENPDINNQIENPNVFTKTIQIVIAIASVFLVGFHMFTSFSGVYPPLIQRTIHLAPLMLVGYLIYPLRKQDTQPQIWDIFLAIAATAATLYITLNYASIVAREGSPLLVDVIMGAILILCLLDIGRRSLGWALPILAAIFMFYALYGYLLPGRLGHRGLGIERLIYYSYMTTEGIFGLPLGVMASYVFLFILFGSLLLRSGAGKLLIDLAYALAGKYVGGPAKVAVVSSAFFGMISGSSTANVVTTGAFTIPLMKSVGYSPAYAGAVEATASTGGVIMPPIMGAAAFVMAELMGVPYIKVAAAAAIPSILYFTALFAQLHFRAVSEGLKGLPPEELPDVKKIMREEGHLLLAPAILIFLLVILRRSPMVSVFWSIIGLVLISLLRANSRKRVAIPLLVETIVDTVKTSVPVTVACGLSGIIIGVATVTGFAVRLSTMILGLTDAYLFPLLLLIMLLSMVLGMGLTATAAYLIPAIMVAPAMVTLGVPKMAAHMFVLYFAIISYITPPVAISAYAAAGIANSNPMRTGLLAVRLGIAGFLVPYLIVYSPALVLEGPIGTTLWDFAFAFVGIIALSAALEGWATTRLNTLERILMGLGAVLMIIPKVGDWIGLGIIAIVLAFSIMKSKRNTPETEAG